MGMPSEAAATKPKESLMPERPINVLLVEDNFDHVELIRRAARDRAPHMHFHIASRLDEARQLLGSEPVDLILIDLVLPDGRGTEILAGDLTRADVPVVVMTCQGNEEAAVQALKRGALDYIVKSPATLNDMPHIILSALDKWGHIVQRRRAMDELCRAHAELERRVEERTRQLAETNEKLQAEIADRTKAESQVRRERQLLRQLLDLHERDRKLLSFEIHDGLAQELAGVHFLLQSIASRADDVPPDVQEIIGTVEQSLGQTIREIRRLINGLRPPLLDESGVPAAVEHLVQEARREAPQITFRFNCSPDFGRLATPLENALFRIVQESLTNARRHARCANVLVDLVCEDDQVRLVIEDDGVGFDPNRVPEKRFGLRGIRERGRLLGGTTDIRSTPGQGTRIEVRLPLLPPPAETTEDVEENSSAQ